MRRSIRYTPREEEPMQAAETPFEYRGCHFCEGFPVTDGHHVMDDGGRVPCVANERK